MPFIYDNIERKLVDAVRNNMEAAYRADMCVGYFNLRGWVHVADLVERFAGEGDSRCRLLIGMQRSDEEELAEALRIGRGDNGVDSATVRRARARYAEHLRKQLTMGVPTCEDEHALRQLARQIRAGKLVVKLFLRHRLHAKLYLTFRHDPSVPMIGYVGSSNLTFSGLVQQGELNVDVVDSDATAKLERWFEDRWSDRWCLDVSEELAQIIEESWARETPLPPYYIYIKMAYHLSEEARQGIAEFRVPRDLDEKLFDYQKKAVQIAAGHLNRRGGVLIGDVVGLGKTLIGVTVARIFEDDRECETLILCPKNLVGMWESYRERYGLRGKVLSISMVQKELPDLRRYRLVLIDESHNFRNRETMLYRTVAEYIERNECFCILMTATPYNKSYEDLGSQLRLFVPEDKHLGVRPEACMRLSQLDDSAFYATFQCAPDTLAAFEKSNEADDWREILRRYMVRRTRSFIIQNYARRDEMNRPYLPLPDGRRNYFPQRVPKGLTFRVDEQYARLYAEDVVETINALQLPRYGLGLYLADPPPVAPTPSEESAMKDLSRAGKRLMGFCRTGLFKRLESSGAAFLQSVDRHILRNELFLHALENGLALPIGTQDPSMLDTRFSDTAADGALFETEGDEADGEEHPRDTGMAKAPELYDRLKRRHGTRFKWLRGSLFHVSLRDALREDNKQLRQIKACCPVWDPSKDAKLGALVRLVQQRHADDKVLVFSQFADTVEYLVAQLKARGIADVAGATGQAADPTELARRFSPVSNGVTVPAGKEIRVLVATDVLSEGQNLQDAHIVVCYDLPWAIIRLVQRVGRVDRIGQQSEEILCYSFLPADGVEKLISLRERLRRRLHENAEVVGTDEQFFDDDRNDAAVANLYNEKAGILDEDEGEVDLASYAYEIWNSAVKADPRVARAVEALPDVAYSTKPAPEPQAGSSTAMPVPEGDSVLVYLQTSDENHALAWVDSQGKPVTLSHRTVLDAAACTPDTPALQPIVEHHDLTARAVEEVVKDQRYVGGQLGRPSGARYRTYERLKRYLRDITGTLLAEAYDMDELQRALEDIYRAPLTEHAREALNRQLRSGISDEGLAEMVIGLRREDRLTQPVAEGQTTEVRVICSMGLRAGITRPLTNEAEREEMGP